MLALPNDLTEATLAVARDFNDDPPEDRVLRDAVRNAVAFRPVVKLFVSMMALAMCANKVNFGMPVRC